MGHVILYMFTAQQIPALRSIWGKSQRVWGFSEHQYLLFYMFTFHFNVNHFTLWKYYRGALSAEKNMFHTCTNHLPCVTHTNDWPPISCSITVAVDQVAYCRQRSYFPAFKVTIKWTLCIQVLMNAIQSLSWTLMCSVLKWKCLLKCSHFFLFRILINW